MTRHAGKGLTAAVAGLLLGVACGGEPSPDTDGEVLRGPDATRRSVTPARYLTDVTFVPFDTAAAAVHYRFRHFTSAEALERVYRAWRLQGDGWRPFLRVRDTLPVPRAGWRVLPAAGLGVVVGDGGELEILVRRDSAGGERLEMGRTLAEWSSPTGQRERLREALLRSGGSRLAGLAVERRRAQGRDVPPSRGLYGFLLLTDSAGDGMVIRRHGGTPPGREPPAVDTTAVAHGWMDGVSRSWPRVRLARDGGRGAPRDASPPAAGWTLEVPGAGIRGRLRPGAGMSLPALPAPDGEGGARAGRAATSASGGDPGAAVPDSARAPGLRDAVRVYAVSGTLRVLDRVRPLRGVGVETGRP